tara:strand:- start:89 stop:280 length:192 start_codon:yes stop_codon:yes gene_type:complete
MSDKNIILFVVILLLALFYFVIRLGAGKKKDIDKSYELTTYLKGVRILIIILGLVGVILWFFI